jgi:hypothetical protein
MVVVWEVRMVKEWLTRRITAQEAEQAHLVTSERLGPDPVPFGFQNAEWQALLAERQEGDEIWEFRSPPDTWKHLFGRAGVALVRDGRIGRCIVTMMN